LALGKHFVGATYSGDNNFGGSSSGSPATRNVVGVTLANATPSSASCLTYSVKAGGVYTCTFTYAVAADGAADTGLIKAQFGTTGNPGFGSATGSGGGAWNFITTKNNNNNTVVTSTWATSVLTLQNGSVSVTMTGTPKCSAGGTIQLIDGFSYGGTFLGQAVN